METVFGVFLGIYILFVLFALAYGVISYVFFSLGLYGISKNRGYNKPWLAWIPFCNSYLQGAVADDIERRYGRRSNYRKLLLGFLISYFVIYPFVFALMFSLQTISSSEQSSLLLIPALLLPLVAIAAIVCYAVFNYISLYKIYKDYVPNNATAFLVLSIFFSFLTPFFVFSLRNKPAASMYGYAPQYGAPYGQYTAPTAAGGYTPPTQQPPQNNDNSQQQ